MKGIEQTPVSVLIELIQGQAAALPPQVQLPAQDGAPAKTVAVQWDAVDTASLTPGVHTVRAVAPELPELPIQADLLVYANRDHQADNQDSWYRRAKYALYVTFSHNGPLWDGYAVRSDGTLPATFQETLEQFDVERFAEDCREMGVEYVNFTSYHGHMYVIWPSQVVNAHLPGHSTVALTGQQKNRDVVRELIDALHRRGIKLQLYIHSTVGDTFTEEMRQATGWHDPTGYYKRWNDFINDFFDEMAKRYGTDIDSYYIDMITSPDYARRMDVERLRKTLKKYNPQVVLTGNGATDIAVDYGSREDGCMTERFSQHLDDKPAFLDQTVTGISRAWFSSVGAGAESPVKFPPEQLFRYLVLTASANRYGGGLALGATPYADNAVSEQGFEPGVKACLVALGGLIAPVAESIKGTYPSDSYLTPAGMTIRQLPHGFVATQSPDGHFTYIHVLRAPASGDTITLPSPLDGKTFGEAVLLPSGKAARLTQDDNGVTLTLPSGEGWDSLDTVFRLTTASVPEQTPVEETLYTGPILATASDADGSHGAEQALDPDLTTFWGVAAPFKTPDGADKYLQLDLGSVQRVTGLILTPRRDSIRRATLQFHLSSYNVLAGETEESLRPVHTGELPQTVNAKEISFPAVSARYIRVTVPPGWDFQYGDYAVYEDHAYASIGRVQVKVAKP